MNKYPKYKETNIDWLGGIPEHWELKRIKFLFLEKNIRSNTGNEELLSLSKYYGLVPRSKITEKQESANTLIGYKICNKDDLVLNKLQAWNGMFDISDYEGIISPDYSVYQQIAENIIDKKYYKYLFKTSLYISEFTKNSSGIGEGFFRLYTDKFFGIFAIYPPLPEQKAIAKFLDDKTQKIDLAISQKEKMIALLKERKQIIIQNAVTGKLIMENGKWKMNNSQLSTINYPLKDSGIEWIGDIPEHWEVKRLKYVTKIFRGKFTHRPRNDARLYDGKYPFFQTGDVAKADKFLWDFKQTLNEKGLKVSTLIPKGTIVLTIAANIGDIAILDIDACFPDSIVGFEAKKVTLNYLYYSLFAMKQQFINSTTKNTQMNLNVERVGNNTIPLPPLSEQKAIVKYIEEETEKMDKAISLQEQQIEKLKEYKQILIDNAVRGKICIYFKQHKTPKYSS